MSLSLLSAAAPQGAGCSYRACGLVIESASPIPGLLEASRGAAPDVRVTVAGLRSLSRVAGDAETIRYASPERDDVGARELTIYARPDGYRISYSEGAEFLVDPLGTALDVSWTAPLTEADAVTYLLGPVLGFLMRLRGTLPMHASAVTIAGRGVLFVGAAGAGKSTTAAAFAVRGYPVLSDDIVPLIELDGQTMVYPGYPRVSIWSDAVEGLFGRADVLPAFSATYPKQYLDLREGGYAFQETPVPIDTIYVMRDREAGLDVPRVRPLSPRAALLDLVGHTYCNYLLDGPMRGREFDFLTRLVAAVPVREVTFGEPLARLGECCEALAVQVTQDREDRVA